MFNTVTVDRHELIPTSQDSPTVYRLTTTEGMDISILMKLNTNPEKLVVLFNGAYNKAQSPVPNFMRWSWAERAGFSYIVVDDPIVSKGSDTNIGWYIGIKDFDLQEFVYNLVKDILTRIFLSPNSIIFFGSSGGGFAALMAAIRMRGSTAVVNNPQTDVLKYSRRLRADFIDIFGEDETIIKKCFYHRFSANEAMDYYNYVPNVLYRQNIQDNSHLNQHFNPFKKHYHKIVKQQDLAKHSLNVIMYDDPKGHSSVATYEDFISDISKAND